MPNSSRPTTKGNPLRNSTCLVYAPGPLVANAFETKCSIRKNPIGTIPVSECKRRSRNECPCMARSGATPLISTGDELTVEATGYYLGREEGKSRKPADGAPAYTLSMPGFIS